MAHNRVNNSLRNIYAGFANKLLTSLFPFVIRTVLIYIIGEKYLGLNSLFSSLLQVLNLSELGFTEAVTYSLYKPIADGNNETIQRYMSFFRKAYKIIGMVILGIGVLLIPILPYFIKGDIPAGVNITLVYLIFLMNTVLSYLLFAYKNVLFVAFQRVRVTDNVGSIIYLFQSILQILIIFVFHNYYYYLLVLPIATVIKNIIISFKANQYFPNIKPKGQLTTNEKKELYIQIKGIMIGKLSDVSRNSLDSIIISSFLGLTVCAIYGNYYYVYVLLYSIVIIFGKSAQASVGDSIASESVQKNLNDFKKLSFSMLWISTMMATLALVLYQDFMVVWVGKGLLLDNIEMILFVIYFYCISMTPIRNMYIDGNALWWNGRWMFVLEAIGNLGLNVILCRLIGLKGILLATIVTIVAFNLFGRSYILFKYYFGVGEFKTYVFSIMKYILITSIVCCSCYTISRLVVVKSLILTIVIKGLLSAFIALLLLWVILHKTNEYAWMTSLLKKIIQKKLIDKNKSV